MKAKKKFNLLFGTICILTGVIGLGAFLFPLLTESILDLFGILQLSIIMTMIGVIIFVKAKGSRPILKIPREKWIIRLITILSFIGLLLLILVLLSGDNFLIVFRLIQLEIFIFGIDGLCIYEITQRARVKSTKNSINI